MEKVLGEEILRKAIQGEDQAYNFYSKVKDLMINKKSKIFMENLANEELKHKNILEKRYKALYGKDFEEIPGFIFDENLKIENLGLNSQSDALQILSSAIEAEKNAIVFYSKLLKDVDNEEDLELLKYLIDFEESHKIKLQNEYQTINKDYYWQTP